MIYKQLGNSDLKVGSVTFGGNVFGWTVDEATSFNLLDGFIHAGFNLIDTADVYSRWKTGNNGGESETIIGNWMRLRENRQRIIIATKVGADMGEGDKRLSKKYIIKAVENSLKRLQTDHIDLYQTHFDDAATPIEETLETYQQLITAGKIRWIGASNLSAERLRLSMEISKEKNLPSYQTFQPHYNLLEREIYEKELEEICIQHHLGVINYYSLASGFLTGKYRTQADLEKSNRSAGVKKYLTEKGLKIIAVLNVLASEYTCSQASITLAWLLTRPSITAPIASATSMKQLQSFIVAAELSLSGDTIEQLNKASAWQ